jgi:hypothetical protein
VALKLIEVEKAFDYSNLELQANDITWDNFKQNFYVDLEMYEMIRIVSSNYKQRHKSQTNPRRNLQTSVDNWL